MTSTYTDLIEALEWLDNCDPEQVSVCVLLDAYHEYKAAPKPLILEAVDWGMIRVGDIYYMPMAKVEEQERGKHSYYRLPEASE